MADQHPNVALMNRLDLRDITACANLFAQDVVLHYANPNLPDLEGDYFGLTGVGTFFEILGAKSEGTFKLEPVSVTACGDELVVAHTRNTTTLQGRSIAIDAVTVWRFVDGRIAEIWDIPSSYVLARAAEAVDA